ncbi:MAG: methylated-DNA--[protein]-cysteine S-methyltransferase [Nitrospinae bacterium]|nr:methylated-DNA--[protein]-cysteine S-methyltransferase [Nitrospinota bacterium]
MVFKKIKSPVGELVLVASEKGLCAVLMEGEGWEILRDASPGDSRVLSRIESQLKEYFAGRRKKFAVPLDLSGTAFQKMAWRALSKIPFGKTMSYSEQAMRMGDSGSARAVGQANGRNPVPIVVPCHRVVPKNGGLGGYSGGAGIKEYLLSLEGAKNF